MASCWEALVFCWRLPGSLPAGRKKGGVFLSWESWQEMLLQAGYLKQQHCSQLGTPLHAAVPVCFLPASTGGEQLGFVTRLRLCPAAPAASQLRVLPSAAFRASALVSSCRSAFSMSHHCSCRGRFASFWVFLLVGALPNSLNAAGAVILHPEQGAAPRCFLNTEHHSR